MTPIDSPQSAPDSNERSPLSPGPSSLKDVSDDAYQEALLSILVRYRSGRSDLSSTEAVREREKILTSEERIMEQIRQLVRETDSDRDEMLAG